MSYPHSLVVICPAAVRDNLLALGDAVGVAGGMDVELSTSGSAPPTHYGSHSWAGPEFVAMMTGQAYPDPLPEGVTTEQIDSILGACTVSVDPVVDEQVLAAREHFDHVLTLQGLQTITSEI